MKNALVRTLAVIALVAGSMLTALPAHAATCQGFPIQSSTSTTVYVQNPCGNLSARYRLESYASGGAVIYQATVVLSPLQTTSFPRGAGGWNVVVL